MLNPTPQPPLLTSLPMIFFFVSKWTPFVFIHFCFDVELAPSSGSLCYDNCATQNLGSSRSFISLRLWAVGGNCLWCGWQWYAMFVLNDGSRDPTLLADQQHLFDSKLDICNKQTDKKSDMWKRFKKWFLKRKTCLICVAQTLNLAKTFIEYCYDIQIKYL